MAKLKEGTNTSSSGEKGATFRWAAPETFDGVFTEKSDVYVVGFAHRPRASRIRLHCALAHA